MALVIAGTGLYWLFSSMAIFPSPRGIETSRSADTMLQASQVVFAPPRPEDAPEDIREGVMLGYHILMDTQTYAKQYVGNKLNCRNCHFNAGRERNTLSLVGVAVTYPKYRERRKYVTDLVTRTQGCFERSMNGKALPPEDKHMQALMAYYHWISKGLPIYADIPWLGLKKLKSGHKPDPAAGKQVFAQVCTRCHGDGGLGTAIAPPLWGPESFNDGAGMHKMKNFSAFTHHFMPKNNPTLSVDQALDVSAYATSQPRPHFQAGK
ncbi:MAG: c-type cytochrome [Desulfarculaceae bacterium]|nr:c-type cytochrome [Desulfarculaceae bacterium]MCF8048213.1 c-type cytochrome [Desulfarculaceae bacterium]MCF8065516.1 c-type cytochrome [Desulfarculaceae bacterium]MCF8099675.1 c-type cytochrome [Desulfarculaceae bacterium]MCF8123575.1 c-type cytochrome [Desulfarculaceae bacterium]